MNRKGEMLARDWVIVLILFGAVLSLAYLSVADIASSESGYGVENMTDSGFQERYDTFTRTSQDIYLAQNATASGEGLSTTSTFTTTFKATFSVISIVFGSFSLANDAMGNFATDFGVPSAVANIIFPALLAILIAVIIFVVISSVSQGKL